VASAAERLSATDLSSPPGLVGGTDGDNDISGLGKSCCCSPRLQLSLLTLSLSRPRTGGGRRQRPEWRRKYFQWPAPERRHGRTNALISLLLKLTVLTQITRMALYRQPHTLRSTKLRPLCTHALTTRPLTALTALTTSYACTNTRHSRPLPTCTPSLTDTISVTRHSLHAAN
jgi:hypothetical protein